MNPNTHALFAFESIDKIHYALGSPNDATRFLDRLNHGRELNRYKIRRVAEDYAVTKFSANAPRLADLLKEIPAI